MKVSPGFCTALCASLAFAGALGTSWVAAAQDATAQQNAAAQNTTELSRLRLGCGDFTRNRDNTWSPTHAITVGVRVVNPTASFRAGESVAGANLGAILDQAYKDQAAPSR